MSSDVRDFKEAMNEPQSTRKGLGFASYVDGIIIAVVTAAFAINNKALEGMSSGASCAILFLVAALLLFTGYFLVKEMKIGDYLAWISALVSFILGLVMTFTSFKGSISYLDIYLLVTGAFMLIFIVLRVITEKGLIKTE